MSKISKSEALYTFHPDSEYVCGSCIFVKELKQGAGCAFLGPALQVSESAGGCNAFAHGHPGDNMFDVPWFSLFTPVQLGYEENKPGFSCKRCKHVDIFREDCDEVDRDSEGDTPGIISGDGCCNLWSPDKVRGHMTREEILHWIEMNGSKHGWAQQIERK